MTEPEHDKSRRLYELAEDKGGYFTAREALAAGYSYRQQHYQRSTGRWTPVGHGLFRLRDFPDGEFEHLVRWSLWSRNQKGVPLAVISHDTALAVHGLSDVMPAAVHLTVPPRFRKAVPSGLVIHRAIVRPEDIEQRAGFAVTTPLRTLLDVAAGSLSQEHLDSAVAQALARGLVFSSALTTAPAPPGARARLNLALTAAEKDTSRDRHL